MDCSIEQMREQARERYRVRRLLMDAERINTQNVRRRARRRLLRDEQRQTNAVGAVAMDQNITSQSSDTYSGVQQTPVTTFMRRHRNCARNFRDSIAFVAFHLADTRTCRFCLAALFSRETSDFCCKSGKIVLTQIASPPEILALFEDQTPIGRDFRRQIRSYNHVFSFTSMGVQFDRDLANEEQGVYTFRAQGGVYHRIGSLTPAEGTKPRFLQMYIYDTDHELQHRMSENDGLNLEIVQKIKTALDANCFVGVLRQIGQRDDIAQCRLIIKEQSPHQRQYSLPSASQVAAVVVGAADEEINSGREIIVQGMHGQLIPVPETAGYYDPLQYPLLLPYGSYGWDLNSRSNNGNSVTCRAFYSYVLQIRQHDTSLFLRGGRLLQQYIVDNYIKIDSSRLRWIRKNQDTLRAEIYQGLQDALLAGENNAANVGRKTVLPSSYNGSPRDMYQRYQDAMALVHKYGKPDIFLTMTCNPGWDEIVSRLKPGQTSQDRPDLTTRVFREKLEELKKDIYEVGVLGKVVAHVHVIEFQKRGLPHVHMLLIFSEEDKLKGPDDYDKIVRAEIPYEDEEPELYRIVLEHMIHGPCGVAYRRTPCMKTGKCKRNYPKPFAPVTTQGNDTYPIYQRRYDGRSVPLGGRSKKAANNSWVVPYNPWLLRKYNCHINVEVCSSISSVKYLYKYVYKGPDCVSLEVRRGPDFDEIQHFVDGRWICAPEALWRIYKFALSKIYPSVERLHIHLPNRQHVRYYSHQSVSNVLADELNSRTMLTEFFKLNRDDPEARQLLYREIPEYYRWLAKERTWVRRLSTLKVIGRIYTIHPSEGDVFFLRVLLNHIRGPTFFHDMLYVNGERCKTFKEAAERLGLLENDDSYRACLVEASRVKMPSALRSLFVTLLVYCQPTGVRRLWDEFVMVMAEDYASSNTTRVEVLHNQVLSDISKLLVLQNRVISDYDLPPVNKELLLESSFSELLQNELSVVVPHEDLLSIDCLNKEQLTAYRAILQVVEEKKNGIFFVDGPGGTGKTYLYRAILASIRKDGGIALATATSGIAATILPGGRTAHSRFKLPLSPKPNSMCLVSKGTDLANLIKKASVIIWDEITMTHRYTFEALDKTFRDLFDETLPFGGKVMVIGGDFRQTLPIIPRGTRTQTINACIVKSDLWKQVRIFRLKENMRTKSDPSYSAYLLKLGNAEEPYVENDMIRVPDDMVIPWENEDSIDRLIDAVFPNLCDNARDLNYIVDRAILTPLNSHVNRLNDRVLKFLPGQEVVFYSFDSVEDDFRNLYQQELLNNISPGGLPAHELRLKIGAPIMLLRNINPGYGMCNGTRLVCLGFDTNHIHAEIVTGHAAGRKEFIPRIPLKTSEDLNLPFQLIRKQFPVRLSFALTINKAQGQTIKHVGIYLPEPVFSHGQMYVALSRGVSRECTKIMVKNGRLPRFPGTHTRNVVYKEVLSQCDTSLQRP